MKLSDSKLEIVRRNNKAVVQDGNQVVKVFNERKPASDVVNEALNLARVIETGLRVPKLIEVSQVTDGEWAGSWALSTEYIPGKNLTQLEQDDIPERQDSYLERFVELQVAYQQVDAPLLNRQKDKLSRMVKSVKSIDPTVRYDLEIRIRGMKSGYKVCHGDFNPTNVIVPDDGSAPYICDWAHVTAGLPEVDAATTYLLFCVEDKDKAEKYLSLYTKKADIARQVIMQWVPVVAAAELSRGRSEKEEFLRGWIDAVFGDE
ncbi:MAG: phosphotransferase family protein [Atopobiaceae bacterium]|jgi:thiamine kinase-like enzyme